MAATDAGLSSLALSTYSNSTYYSTFFNGSTDAFSIPNNAAFYFGTGDFTIEFWWYLNTPFSSSNGPGIGQKLSDATGGWVIYRNQTVNTTVLSIRTAGQTGASNGDYVCTAAPIQGVWEHWAVVKSGTVLTWYKNGVAAGSYSGVTTNVTDTNTAAPMYVGFAQTWSYYTHNSYVSNLRILKGTALYTAAFNPPTTQLTAIANTSLLTCNSNSFTDGSANNFTITRIGNTGFKQFTPPLRVNASVTLTPTFTSGTRTYTFNAPSNVTAISVTPTPVDPALATMKYNGNVTLTSGQSNIASAAPFFNNGYSETFTAGLLQYTNAAPINVQGFSWTAELWVNPTGSYPASVTLFAKRVSATTSTAYEGYLSITTGAISFFNGTAYVSGYTLPANTWSHVAYTYDGASINIYVNGTRVHSAAVTITDNTEPLTIGGARGYAEWMLGNISNFRFVKGYVIYTQTFTPPSQPFELTQSSRTGVRAITGAPTNGNSGYFNGTSSFLNVTGSGSLVLASNFTIEAWVYPMAIPAAEGVIVQKDWQNTVTFPSFMLYLNNAARPGIWAGTGGAAGYQQSVVSATALPLHAWSHLAYTYDGSTYRLWVNGVSMASMASTGTIASAGNTIRIGAANNPSSYFTGYISNLRIVNGTNLYTTNFTSSTVPLPTITNTRLLALQSSLTTDASTNNFTLTNNNVTLSTAASPFSGGTGSNQFLNTSLAYQVVQNPYNPALSLGQGHNNFTAECWAYLTALPPAAPGWYLIQKGVGTGPGVEWAFSITSTAMHFQAQSGIPYATTIVNNSSNPVNMTVGQWNHFAITKVGTSMHFWFNGIYSGTINGVNNFYYSSAATSVVTIANSSNGSAGAFAGFISNARVVYGKAVYTADINTGFTPSTTELTAIQSATATTASIDNASSSVVANGSSVYFNNTNDFLTFPEPTAATGDVTIEAWVLLSAAPTTRGWIINNNAASTGYFGVAIEAARTITVFSDSNATAVLTSSKIVPLNTWTHIAVVFVNGNIYTYINGWRDTNTIVKTTVWGAATPGTVFVGRQASAAAQYFPGYITNLHVVYNTAVYTTKFSVPSNPSTPITNTVFLGLQSSVTLDSSSSNRTITRGAGSTGLLLAPMTSPFTTYIPAVNNSYSLALGWGTSSTSDGVSVALTSVSSVLLLGDFTIELWAYLEVMPASAAVFVSSSLSTYAFSVSSTGLLTFSPGLVGTTVIAPKTWYHFAATRQRGTLKLWINGILEASVASTGTLTGNGVSSLNIGFSDSPVRYFYGYMNNFRFIPGTCIYTGNFTPSTVPYSLTSSGRTNTLAVTGITTYPAVGNPTGISYSGSAYLEGGSTTAPNSGRYELSTFDFTIEGWFNCNGVTGTHVIMNHGQNLVSDRSWKLYVLKQTATTGYLYFEATGGKAASTTTITVTSGVITINSNQWYHTAAVRIGNVITLYLNGLAVATQTLSTSFYMLGVSTQAFTIGNESSQSSNFNGYLSNLRIIRGYGIYTGAFTPPTAALTNTQASGTNIIALGNQIPALGNSVYFNGTTDYMKVSGGATTMGTGDFTIETYYYSTSFATTFGPTIFGQFPAGVAAPWWNVTVSTTGLISVFHGAGSFTTTTPILINEWYHIAIVRISGTITLYVNGTSYSTASYSGQFGSAAVANPLYIGATQSAGPTQYSSGYMSNLRVVKGVGVYTGAFIVPTSPLTLTQSSGTNISAITGTSTSLLLFQNSPFTDNSTFNNLITGFGNPQYSPVFSPSFFTYPTPTNGNSGYFNGTSSFLSLTQPSNAGTGNFTIELWVYPTVLAATNYLLSTSTNAANCFHLWITSTGVVSLAVDSATASISSDTQMFAKVGAWTHIAITRNSGVVYMYINGIRQQTTLTKATQFGDTGLLNIGRNQPSVNQFFSGYITNVRFVYGTPAVYISDGSTSVDTPPYTNPLTAITNTTLLLLQSTLTKDNSTNNVTVTNTGVILSTYTNPYTMLKMPVLLTAQVGTPGVNFRDSSMYSAIFAASTAATGYHPTVSPFGVAPLILLGQTLNNIHADSSIGNYTLSLNTANIMPYVTPFSGNAIAFNGSTQYITGTSLYNTLGGDFTIEFFMMAGPQTSATASVLLSRNAAYSPATTNNYYIVCEHVLFSQQTISIHKVGLGGFFVGATPVCDSKWHHIALVRINNIVKLYVDGVLDPSAQNSFVNSDVWDYSNYTIGSNPSDGGATVAQLAYSGMLSNLRIINGTGIYTGTFTPPTNNLTTSQTSRTNVIAYTPTAPVSAGNSLQFSGTTNTHIAINPSVGLSLYLNDYTIEFWHYLTGRPAGSTTPCLFNNYSSYAAGSLGMFAGHNLSDITKYQIAFNGFTFPAYALVSNTSIIYGKWTHIAIVRRSGTVYLYINGVLDSFSPYGNYNVTSLSTTSYQWFIGSDGSALTTNYISGFISNFRVVNGVAVYSGSNTSTANFTVPTSPLTVTQSSGTNIAAISNTIVSNGGAIYFPATVSSAYQTIPSVILTPGTYDWTVEGWVFFNAMPTTDAWAAGSVSFFGSDSVNAADGTHCVIGQTQMFVAVTNTKYGTVNHGMSIYNWYHIAYVKINNTVNFYVNGVQLGSVASVPTNGTATTTYIGTAAGSPSYTMNGYISNLRVVKYLGIYTSTFPALTSPLALTQNAVTTVSAITGTSTSLLALQNSATTDASSNNFTLTVNGSAAIVNNTPFNATISGLFDGTSGYLTLGAATVLTSQNFTMELWFNIPTGLTYLNNGSVYSARLFSTSAVSGFEWTINSGSSSSTLPAFITFSAYGNGASFSFPTSATIPLNQWNHAAVSRNGSNYAMWINGVRVGTYTNSFTFTSAQIYLGSAAGATGYLNYFPGYISNARYVSGAVVYDPSLSTITVPTSPLTAIANTDVLLLQTSLTTDASGNNRTITVTGGVTLNTINYPNFPVTNGYSVSFNGASNYITIPSNAAFTFGTDNFTIEGWIYLATDTTTGTLYDARTGATTVSAQIYIASTVVNYAVAGVRVITGATLNTTTWYHIAVVRISGVTKLYVNGTQSGNSYTDTNNYVIGSPYIGTGYGYSFPLTGYISNLRVVDGVGVYSGIFAVPTSPLTSTRASVTPVAALSNPSANGYSVNLNGTSQYLTVPQSAAAGLQFGTGNFTIEFWIRTTDTAGAILSPLNGVSTGYWNLYISASSLIWQSSFGQTTLLTISTPSITDGIWHHVAVVRISSTTVIYIDGVQAGTVPDATNYTFVNSGLQIGSDSVQGATGSNSGFLSGLLSNIRIVKGVGVYTGNFILPATPLTSTQTAGTNITAITGTSTQLLAIQSSLTTDASTNNTTLTAVNSPLLSAIGPFTTSATAANGYSAYLSGSTQYLTVPVSSVFTFAGDFTIEAWVNMPATGAGPYSIFGMFLSGGWFDFRYFQNNFQVSLNAGSGTALGGSLSANTWTHVALVRIAGSIKCYVGGVATGTTLTNSASLGYPTTAGAIGRSGTANFFIGYMSNIRIVIGVGVYLGNFTPSTTPLTATQSAGTNIAAITGTSTALLALQNSLTTDASTNNFTLTAVGSPALYTGSAQSPFNVNVVNSGVVLLTAQSGITVDSAIGYPITNTNGLYQTAITPFGIQVPVTLLTAQSNIANVDNSTANITSYINATGANVRTSNVYGPFNSDASLLTFQGSLITDYSNNRAQMTVVGGGVSPTDSSPFTTSKSLTSLLVPYGYVDTSYANATIANTANTAVTNFSINPFSIPSTLVSVLGLQTSNITLESGIGNSTFTTVGTAPTSNTSSPFGTYSASGLITLNTSATTGIVGNVVNYANILVTAGDTVTTNAYSIVINTSLLANIGNRSSIDSGALPSQSNTTFDISNVVGSTMGEATILSFANTAITPSKDIVDYGFSVSPSNITFIITDVANSNLSETLSNIFVSNVQSVVNATDGGLTTVAPSNVTFFITDVANSNISETIANVVVSNVSSTRSITDTGTLPPSPVGGTVLFPTYAYTDGIKITAANVEGGGGGGGTFVSNQQIWYQG